MENRLQKLNEEEEEIEFENKTNNENNDDDYPTGMIPVLA